MTDGSDDAIVDGDDASAPAAHRRSVSRRAMLAGAGFTILGVALPGSPLTSIVGALESGSSSTSSTSTTSSTTTTTTPGRSPSYYYGDEPFVGEIRMFAGSFVPYGWLNCDGSTYAYSQYNALGALLMGVFGGTYGSTFVVPDLRGRVLVGAGAGPGLTPRSVGEMGGTSSVTLQTGHLPPHGHQLSGSTATATTNSPNGTMLATPPSGAAYGPATNLTAMAPLTVTGSSIPHENRIPSTALYMAICWDGVYPVLS